MAILGQRQRSADKPTMVFAIGSSIYRLYLLPEWEVESVSAERIIIVTKQKSGKKLDCYTFRPYDMGRRVTSYWQLPPPFSRIQRATATSVVLWRTVQMVGFYLFALIRILIGK